MKIKLIFKYELKVKLKLDLRVRFTFASLLKRENIFIFSVTIVGNLRKCSFLSSFPRPVGDVDRACTEITNPRLS